MRQICQTRNFGFLAIFEITGDPSVLLSETALEGNVQRISFRLEHAFDTWRYGATHQLQGRGFPHNKDG